MPPPKDISYDMEPAGRLVHLYYRDSSSKLVLFDLDGAASGFFWWLQNRKHRGFKTDQFLVWNEYSIRGGRNGSGDHAV